jgi:hypothetical protein
MQLMTVNNLTFDHDLTEYLPRTENQRSMVVFWSESGDRIAAVIHDEKWTLLSDFNGYFGCWFNRNILDDEGYTIDLSGQRGEWWGILLDLAVEAGLEIPATA